MLPATTRGVCLATGVLLALLLLISAWRAYPFSDDVTLANSAGDDWLIYKQNAVDILHRGLSMPSVQDSYSVPAGFLYNYFVAAVFAATGENSKHVYLVQAALLALSVGLTSLAFKPFLSDVGRAAYFWLLAFTLFLDIYLTYTFRLLSENLVIFLLSVFYLMLLRGQAARSALLVACAGAVLGLCALTRPNLALVAPAAVILLLLRPRRPKCALLFLIAFVAVFSLLPLRNYVAAGQFSVPIFISQGHWQTPAVAGGFGEKALTVVVFYARRILFCSGFTLLELPWYWLRPHWPFIWAGAFDFAMRALKKRRLEFWESFALSFIPVYLVPVIALAQISNYGVRMIAPVIPVVLLLAVQAASDGRLLSIPDLKVVRE